MELRTPLARCCTLNAVHGTPLAKPSEEAQQVTREIMTGTSKKVRTKPCQEEHRTPRKRHWSQKQGARGWVRACETRAREDGHKHTRYCVRHYALGGETTGKKRRGPTKDAPRCNAKVWGVATRRVLRRKPGARGDTGRQGTG